MSLVQNPELKELMQEANKIYWANNNGVTHFERAIFISWYCSIGDCTFCYMSTQKDQIKDPKLAKRQIYSLLAEAILCKAFNWKIGFISGGYGVYNYSEVCAIVKQVHDITGQKQIMNTGVIPKEDLEQFLPYISHVTGSTETVNEELHKKVCPSKPLEPITKMFKYSKEMGLGNVMTFIVGLGETKDDFSKMVEYINTNKIDKIIIYALNAIKGTVFEKGPEPEYYLWWLAKIRIEFPTIEIVCGTWVQRLSYLSDMLKCGVNNFTKLPVWRVVGSKFGKIMNDEMEKAGRKFISEFEVIPDVDFSLEVAKLDLDEAGKEIVLKDIEQYLSRIRKRIGND